MLRKDSSLFILIVFFSFVLFSLQIKAQDTLPNFSVLYSNNKIIVRWVNQNIKINQVNIQRSPDEKTGFKTIAAIEQPQLNLFEFIDVKAINEFQNYRLYITEEGGNYQFTKSQKPIIQNYKNQTISSNQDPTTPLKTTSQTKQAISENVNPVATSGSHNEIIRIVSNPNSLNRYAKIIEITSQIKIKLSNKQDSSYPHVYSFVNQQGQFEIVQSFSKTKRVKYIFFKEDGAKLFTLNDVKESQFVLDKTNFLQSGWFYFELYENDKFITKQKFYLPK